MLRQLIIDFNDGLIYFLLLILAGATILVLGNTGLLEAATVFLLGGAAIFIVSGFWVVLSSSYKIQKEQLELLQSIKDKLEDK